LLTSTEHVESFLYQRSNMSTHNARKRTSDEMDNGPSTPTGSPTKKMRITQPQKQALIDNLQLEGKARGQ